MSLEEDPELRVTSLEDVDAMQVDVDVATSKVPAATSTKKNVQSLENVPGTTSLPVARVQRIVKADKDILMVNKEAIFAISIVTEHFIKRMTEKAYEQARVDHRKNVTLKDMSTAIKNYPEFEFLSGIVPEAVPLSVALAARAKKAAEDASGPSEESTTTIGDVITKIPLFPGNDPDYPDSLVKKNPNSQSKKSKPVTIATEKNSPKAKDVTPTLPSPSIRLSSRGRKLKGAHEEAIGIANGGDGRDPGEAATREGSPEQEPNTA